MAELVFGKSFNMLGVADNRFIIELIQVAAFRVGVCLQMPILAAWNLDKIFTPSVRKLRDQYVSVSRVLAVDRMNMNSKRQDLFSHILAARDPQTGKGFTMDEIWGESTLLIVAGTLIKRAESLLCPITLTLGRLRCYLNWNGGVFLLFKPPPQGIHKSLR